MAGDLALVEANSTDLDTAGFRGPASISANASYRGQLPNAKNTSAGSVLAWAASSSGTGTPADPYICLLSWIIPITADSSTTLTEKTLDVDGTNNVLKTWGYAVLTHPTVFAAGVTQQTTVTSRLYGQALFADDADVATNYIEYLWTVPSDIDTSVDLVGTFQFVLGGADTADHDYLISLYTAAASAAYDTAADLHPVNLAFTADGSGADKDVEYAGPTTLTDWAGHVTAGQMCWIRVARDGDDGTNDASTVDSYSMGLTIKYKRTQ